MSSDSGSAPAVQSVGHSYTDEHPSKTLVLENIHARTTPAAILHLLARLAGVDPLVLHEIRIRNAIKRGRIERHAFLEFWRLRHAIGVYERLGHFLHIQCPRPRSGEVGRVTDDSGVVVYGDEIDRARNMDMDGYAFTKGHNCCGKDASIRSKIRFYTEVRVVFWRPFVGRADPACLSKQGWECSECGLPNYEKWEFCYRCGVERPWSENVLYRPAEQPAERRVVRISAENGNGILAKYRDQVDDEAIDITM